jgi:transcriptional regulator with XRE-family HTH domain
MEKNKEIEAFAKRLILICDEQQIPVWGRQGILAKMFGVSQNGAKKWIDGDSWPRMETLIKMSEWANISIDWLITGRGEKRKINAYSSEPLTHVVQIMENMTPEQQYLLARLADQVAKPPQNDETEHNTNQRGEQ